MSDFINMEAEYITQSHICLCNRCMPKLKKFVEENPDYTLVHNKNTPKMKKGAVCDICGFRKPEEIFTFAFEGQFKRQSAFIEFMSDKEIIQSRAYNIMKKRLKMSCNIKQYVV